MAKHMSFAKTTEQIRNHTKTVTRRMGWTNLKPGTILQAVNKLPYAKGEKEKLALIRVMDVRREPLWNICDDDGEVVKEGFTDIDVYEFVDMFCEFAKCHPSDHVTRIEFEYVEDNDE